MFKELIYLIVSLLFAGFMLYGAYTLNRYLNWEWYYKEKVHELIDMECGGLQ